MSFADLLIHWCAIQEDTGAVVDAYGHTTEVWTAVTGLDDFPCRLKTSSGREILVGAEVVVADYKLFLDEETPGGVAVLVTEQNRAYVWVKDASGAWIGITYEILLVNHMQNGVDGHHTECYLRTVR